MTDDPRITVYRVGEEAAQRVIQRPPAGEEAAAQRVMPRPPAGKPAGRAPGRRRGVAVGRIAAAGIGVAAVIGLAANMQLAGGHAEAAQAATPAAHGPKPSVAALRWESAFQGPATKPDRLVASTGRKPIVLTPHTIVNTVGGGSSGGSSGGSYAGSYAAPAAAAAPVATTSGSTPH